MHAILNWSSSDSLHTRRTIWQKVRGMESYVTAQCPPCATWWSQPGLKRNHVLVCVSVCVRVSAWNTDWQIGCSEMSAAHTIWHAALLFVCPYLSVCVIPSFTRQCERATGRQRDGETAGRVKSKRHTFCSLHNIHLMWWFVSLKLPRTNIQLRNVKAASKSCRDQIEWVFQKWGFSQTADLQQTVIRIFIHVFCWAKEIKTNSDIHRRSNSLCQ